jgi:hypothetical protein
MLTTKAVIIINGKVSNVRNSWINQSLIKLKKHSIEKIDRLWKSKHHIIQKFGEQAMNGIIYIETKD